MFKFVGIDSISDAEPWHGADVLVPAGERARPGEGEYSHADLIGCAKCETGCVAARRPVGGSRDGRRGLRRPDRFSRWKRRTAVEILIPFARAICKEIDVAAKTIRVELPEGSAGICKERPRQYGNAARWRGKERVMHHAFHVLTIFPEFFRGPFEHGVIQRAQRGRADRDSGSRSADLDARSAPDRG